MLPWIAWCLAVISTAICLRIWFRDVRRIMRDRLSTVESATEQLAACRRKAAEADAGTMAAVVLARSERIYQQAVELYDQTLRKPRNAIPAHLMGYRPMGKRDATAGRRECE